MTPPDEGRTGWRGPARGTASDAALGALLIVSLSAWVEPFLGGAHLLLVLAGGPLAGHFLFGCNARRYFRRLDHCMALGEGALVTLALAVMTGAVFLDVSWRALSGATAASLWAVAGGFLALCLLGGLTSSGRGSALGRAARLKRGLSAYAFVVIYGALVRLVPNGFGWSQRLALVLLLWVGMLGASLATRRARHIRVDPVARSLPAPLVQPAQRAADLVTATACALLAILAVRYVGGNWDDWWQSQGGAGVFASIPIPYFAATLPIAIGFGTMGLRFLGQALFGRPTAHRIQPLEADDAAAPERSGQS